jgi:hypothetical protein
MGRMFRGFSPRVVVQFGKEASQTRDYCVAKNATLRAARPDPSPRKKRLLRMTIKLHHYPPRHGVASTHGVPVELLVGDLRVSLEASS